jgi:DNA-binding transcriptional LysR family regulator
MPRCENCNEEKPMALDMLREIQAFVSVAHKRSFVSAARALGRSPSAVTRAVQALEDNSGAKLFNRSASTVTLTEAGERLLPHAERLLDVQRDAADELAALAGSAQGWIRLAAPEVLAQQVLPQVLAEFSRRHPQVTLDVQFSDQRSTRCWASSISSSAAPSPSPAS